MRLDRHPDQWMLRVTDSPVEMQLVRKKAKGRGGKSGQAAMKYEPVDSFFNFFSPPAVPQGDEEPDDEAMEALQSAMEEDYEIGSVTRMTFIVIVL